MELFKYKAIDKQGKSIRGRSDAINVGDLEVRLNRSGLDLISYKQVRKTQRKLTRSSIKRRDQITFCFHLEQLLQAGVPILEALADLRDSVDNPRFKEVTIAMIETISGGKSLSEALADFPNEFDHVFVSLIQAGEQSGELTTVLENISANLKWQDEQAAHAKTLLIYPLFVFSLLIGVFFFLMLYLMPELSRFFTTMGHELPVSTRILLSMSEFFLRYWPFVILLPLLLSGIIQLLMRSNNDFLRWVDGLKLRLPVIGPILKKIIMTRFTNYFAIMYASGITVMDCVKSGEQIVGNSAVAAAVNEAESLIGDGYGISAAFEKTELFPPLVLRMFRVGENTGTLEKSLQNVSYFYNREVKESIEHLQEIIGPTLLMIIGAFVVVVMLSILGPIYDLFTQIKI